MRSAPGPESDGAPSPPTAELTAEPNPPTAEPNPPTAERSAPEPDDIVGPRWRAPVFGLVDHVRVRRRAGDGVRVAAAVLVVVVVVLAAELLARDGPLFERSVDLVPDGVSWAATAVAWVGSVGQAAALALVAALERRWRLLATMAAVGAVALAFALVVTDLLGAGAREVLFPTLAMATASAVGPYLTRPAGRAVDVVAAAAVAATALAGSVAPVGVAVAVVAGWGTAAAFRLATGSPVGFPSARQVAAGASELGVTVGDLAPVDYGDWGAAAYSGRDGSGRAVLVTVYGRDAEEARLLSRVWRFLWYRSDGPALAVSRLQQVEHEALVLVLAARAGIEVPGVVAAGMAEDTEDALLVASRPPGRPLEELDDSDLDDGLLDAMWACQQRLASARLTHGCLDDRHVVVERSGAVGFVDFRRGMVSAPRDRRARDVAQLLATLALRVGEDRAVESAVRNVPRDQLVAALEQLQPAAFAGRTRSALRHRNALVKGLRTRTASALDVEPPELVDLHRVSWADVLVLAGTFFGFWMLMGQLSGLDDIGSTLAAANWAWVVVALLISQTTNFAQAYALTGSVSTPLPFGPVVGLQFGLAFTGLVGGTVANTATIIRFFQRRGLAASVAVSSGVVVSLASSIVQAVLFALCFAFVHEDFTWSALGSSDDGGSSSDLVRLLLVGIVVVGLATGVGLFVPRFRSRVLAKVKPQLATAVENLRALASDPRLTSRLFVGNLIAQVLFALTLGASLHAYGESASLAALIVVNTIASLIGGIAPVPGGMGVIEAGLIAGFTAYGIPVEQATAAVFTSRLFTAYLPPAWGWPCLAWLRRNDYL